MKKQFELKEEHIKLLSKTYIGWNGMESGAPSIDPKRPYGNSDVVNDVLRILAIEILTDCDDEEIITKEQEEWAWKLHEETKTALEVILSNQSFAPGLYEKEGYGITWKKIS